MSQEIPNFQKKCEGGEQFNYQSTNDLFEEGILGGIKIVDESDFDLLAKRLQEFGDFDITKAIDRRDSLDKNFAEDLFNNIISLFDISDEGIIIRKEGDSLTVYNSRPNIKTNKNTLLGVIYNGKNEINVNKSEDDKLKDQSLLPINITHISDIEKSINLFEEKNKKCEEVIVGTQKNVVVMKTQVEDTFGVSKENRDNQTDTIDNNDIVPEMSPVTPKEENVFPTVDEINGLTQDETTEETIANLLYEIKKGDNLWSIIESKYSGQKTQIILKYLIHHPEIIGLPEGSDISKIKIGQKISIPSNILDTANRENQNGVEVDKNITKYKVQFGDTLFTIFKARYEDVKGYGSFLNKFNELQNNKNFTITDLNKVIKAGDTINLP